MDIERTIRTTGIDMNRKSFLKTGLLGALIGLFTSKSNAFYKLLTVSEKTLCLNTHMAVFQNSKEELESRKMAVKYGHFNLTGTSEEIMKKVIMNAAAVLAKAESVAGENSDKSNDFQHQFFLRRMKQLRDKYE